MRLFSPDEKIGRFSCFDGRKYREKGYEAVLIDIDNTMTPYDEEEPDQEVRDFLKGLREAGLLVILLSNNTRQRVERYVKDLDCPYRHMSLKPLSFVYLSLIREYRLDPKKTVCLGDQLLTDVLGGKILGMHTVYCKPVSDRDNFTGSISRAIERKLMK